MTTKKFLNAIFSANTKVTYKDKDYFVWGVDFSRGVIAILTTNGMEWIDYSDCEIGYSILENTSLENFKNKNNENK